MGRSLGGESGAAACQLRRFQLVPMAPPQGMSGPGSQDGGTSGKTDLRKGRVKYYIGRMEWGSARNNLVSTKIIEKSVRGTSSHGERHGRTDIFVEVHGGSHALKAHREPIFEQCKMWGGNCSREELLWTDHCSFSPSACTTWGGGGSRVVWTEGVKVSLGRNLGEGVPFFCLCSSLSYFIFKGQ